MRFRGDGVVTSIVVVTQIKYGQRYRGPFLSGENQMSERGTRVLARNAKAIEAVKPKARRVVYSVKGERGLRLAVHPSGRKTWHVVYLIGNSRQGGSRHWHEIGDTGNIPLPKACE